MTKIMKEKFEQQLNKMKELVGPEYAVEGSGYEDYVSRFEKKYKKSHAKAYGVKVETTPYSRVLCIMYIDDTDYMWGEWERCLKEDGIADCYWISDPYDKDGSGFDSCYIR